MKTVLFVFITAAVIAIHASPEGLLKLPQGSDVVQPAPEHSSASQGIGSCDHYYCERYCRQNGHNNGYCYGQTCYCD